LTTDTVLRSTHLVAPRAQGTDSTIGIERAGYVALKAADPAAAAAFAADHLGFSLVHVDQDGRHFLAAAGPDPYSLVYVPGDGENGVDHGSYVVNSLGDLDRGAAALEEKGVVVDRIADSPLFRHGPAVRFAAPNGTTLELTIGVAARVPVSEHVPPPLAEIAPICFDHVILRHADVAAANAFAQEVLGLKESGQIMLPNGDPLLTFFRSHTLFHCYGTANSPHDGLHHVQFTLKNDRALFRAYEAIRGAGAVEVIWGPLRHGCGQNLAFYLLDAEGHIFEYSAEEEVILDDECYEVQRWPVDDPHAGDEWSNSKPPEIMK
jgi:catechol 2,3-dioxygenase